MLLAVLNQSCQNPEVIIIERYDNGEVKKSNEVLSPNKQIKREYTENGFLVDSFVEINGKVEGLRRLLLKDSSVVSESYKNGQLDGEYNNYYPSCELKITGKFKDGNKVGKHTMFYKNGIIKQEVECLDGFEHGEDEFYYRSGALKRKGIMALGEQEGSWYRYYPDGKLKIYEYFIKGKRRFIRQYNEDGKYKDDGDLMADVKLNFYCVEGIKMENGADLPEVINLKSDSIGYKVKFVNPPNSKNYLLVCEDLPNSKKVCGENGNSVAYNLNKLDSSARDVLHVIKLKGKVEFSMRMISVDTLMKTDTSFLHTQAYFIK